MSYSALKRIFPKLLRYHNFYYDYNLAKHIHHLIYKSELKINLNNIKRNHKSILPYSVINRYMSNSFSITWKKKAIRSHKNEVEEREKVSHLVINSNLYSANEQCQMNIDKQDIKNLLLCLNRNEEINRLAYENGMDKNMLFHSFITFRRLCSEAKLLPTDLYRKIEGLKHGTCTAEDLFPYLLKQALKLYPHLNVLDELKEIADMSTPEKKYYEARSKKRKIIFHSGPTNSGKTYHAMKRFLQSSSGVYCSPLRLLAMEVYHKSNEAGVTCDLITGEERRSGYLEYSECTGNDSEYNSINEYNEDIESSHIACTAEMIQLDKEFDVAIIDEIQTIKSESRGWAWTRALLGLNCNEIHVCGEASAIDLVKKLVEKCEDDFELKTYTRLTPLEVDETPFLSIDQIQPGDCIVCFNRNRIIDLSKEIQSLGHEVAIIYGNLPPSTKLDMARRFNDPNDKCKILIATDAIGMGLNLSIRRIIFDTLKTSTTNNGVTMTEEVDISSVLQIAGRAGRYGTRWEKGFVGARSIEDLQRLKEALALKPKTITNASLMPELELFELFSYYMPDYTFQQILETSRHLCKVDEDLYFYADTEHMKYVSDKLQHIPLNIRQLYTLSYAPINRTQLFENQIFIKFTRHIAENQQVTLDWLCSEIHWPCSTPITSNQLHHVESVYNVLELYCWLSYNYPQLFTNVNEVREMKIVLEDTIIEAVNRYSNLNEDISRKNIEKGQFSARQSQRVETTNKQEEEEEKQSAKLLKLGILTPVILQQLKDEWELANDNHANNDCDSEIFPSELDEPQSAIPMYEENIELNNNDIHSKSSCLDRLFKESDISVDVDAQIEKLSTGDEIYKCSVTASKFKGYGEGFSIKEAENNALQNLNDTIDIAMNELYEINESDFKNELNNYDEKSQGFSKSEQNIHQELSNHDQNSPKLITSEEKALQELYNSEENTQELNRNEGKPKELDNDESIYNAFKSTMGLDNEKSVKKSAITRLNELCMKAKVNLPIYEIILAEPFQKGSWKFKFAVKIFNYYAVGEGSSKKSAKESAAEELFKIIDMESNNSEKMDKDSLESTESKLISVYQETKNSKQIYNEQDWEEKLSKNPVMHLNNICLKANRNPPKYVISNLNQSGNKPFYQCDVFAADFYAKGEGSSKVRAKVNASKSLLKMIKSCAYISCDR